MTKATLRGGPEAGGGGGERGVCAGVAVGATSGSLISGSPPQLLGRTRPESSLWLVLCAALQLGALVGYLRLLALCVSGQLGGDVGGVLQVGARSEAKPCIWEGV